MAALVDVEIIRIRDDGTGFLTAEFDGETIQIDVTQLPQSTSEIALAIMVERIRREGGDLNQFDGQTARFNTQGSTTSIQILP